MVTAGGGHGSGAMALSVRAAGVLVAAACRVAMHSGGGALEYQRSRKVSATRQVFAVRVAQPPAGTWSCRRGMHRRHKEGRTERLGRRSHS